MRTENNGQQADIHRVHMRTECNDMITYAPCARTNLKSLKRVRRRAHLLIVCNGSRLAVAYRLLLLGLIGF